MLSASRISVFVFVLFSFVCGFAQQSESDRLKREQQDLLKKISFTQNLLETTQENRQNLTQGIGLIDRKIQYRSELLNNLNNQLSQLALEIEDHKAAADQLNNEIERQKTAYKLMLIHAYKMRSSTASLLFILSSESFNQASKRMAYLRQLSKFRSDQIRRIESSKKELDQQLADLERKQKEKMDLIGSQQSEQQQYVADREYQKRQIENLSGKEQQLQNELLAQQKKSRELQNALNAALNKEILEKKKKKEDDKPLTDAEIKEIKEIELSNKGFEADKGKLPWPVNKGEITKGFGKHAHPLHVNVYTYNNGIDITTVKGSTVRAVYAGEVTSVIIIPGAGKAVIIAHGDYRSIYSNLSEAYVSKGDKVDTKQEIGTLLVNESGTSEVHFEICKITPEGEIVHVNPTYWIVPN